MPLSGPSLLPVRSPRLQLLGKALSLGSSTSLRPCGLITLGRSRGLLSGWGAGDAAAAAEEHATLALREGEAWRRRRRGAHAAIESHLRPESPVGPLSCESDASWPEDGRGEGLSEFRKKQQRSLSRVLPRLSVADDGGAGREKSRAGHALMPHLDARRGLGSEHCVD